MMDSLQQPWIQHRRSQNENPGPEKRDITKLDIVEIKECGKFTPAERSAEYRRRGKSPSGVIDGVYIDEYRGDEDYQFIKTFRSPH
jgi:hypothetical protein